MNLTYTANFTPVLTHIYKQVFPTKFSLIPNIIDRQKSHPGKAAQWIDCIMAKILKNFEIVKFIITALKIILNLNTWPM